MITIIDIIKKAQTAGLIDNSISPQMLSLMLGGSSQLLYYGLFLQRTRNTVININNAESIDESKIKNAIETLINKFIL